MTVTELAKILYALINTYQKELGLKLFDKLIKHLSL